MPPKDPQISIQTASHQLLAILANEDPSNYQPPDRDGLFHYLWKANDRRLRRLFDRTYDIGRIKFYAKAFRQEMLRVDPSWTPNAHNDISSFLRRYGEICCTQSQIGLIRVMVKSTMAQLWLKICRIELGTDNWRPRHFTHNHTKARTRHDGF